MIIIAGNLLKYVQQIKWNKNNNYINMGRN